MDLWSRVCVDAGIQPRGPSPLESVGNTVIQKRFLMQQCSTVKAREMTNQLPTGLYLFLVLYPVSRDYACLTTQVGGTPKTTPLLSGGKVETAGCPAQFHPSSVPTQDHHEKCRVRPNVAPSTAAAVASLFGKSPPTSGGCTSMLELSPTSRPCRLARSGQ